MALAANAGARKLGEGLKGAIQNGINQNLRGRGIVSLSLRQPDGAPECDIAMQLGMNSSQRIAREISRKRASNYCDERHYFFLLVFFMTSTLSMSQYKGMPVNLPKAASGQQAPAESAASTITKEEPVEKQSFIELLREQTVDIPIYW
jgi:hypothetical protein